jgi:hypothetical protein
LAFGVERTRSETDRSITLVIAPYGAPRLRQALITIGVQVVRSVRRIVLHFPRSHPDAATWVRLARALGATTA